MSDSHAQSQRIAYLISGFLQHRLTEPERKELDDWLSQSDANVQLFENLTDEKNIHQADHWLQHLDVEAALADVRSNTTDLVRKPVTKKIWVAAAAAVLIVAIAMVALWFQLPRSSADKQQEVSNASVIEPGTFTAFLKTSEHDSYTLGTSTSQTLQFDSHSQAVLANNTLTYDKAQANKSVHILSTPAGGTYRLVLSDGTRVWLNAASSIQYPVSFPGKTRRVDVTGEAYFEVAHDASKPFIVGVGGGKVTVLGTKFNVNAYSEEQDETVSLLEGSIRHEYNGNKHVLKPMQEVIANKDGVRIIDNAGVDEKIAWTKGEFSFMKTPQHEVLLQISRWYKVGFNDHTSVKQTFTGKISRNAPLRDVVRMLQLASGLNIHIEKNNLVVRP